MTNRTREPSQEGEDVVPPLPIRVLICEDQSLTILGLRTALGQLQFNVVGEARNGEEAVCLVRELQPDVVLMDVNMPRLDGISAAEQIMAERPTPVVMLTAYSDPATIQRALDAGAAGYLVKPVRTEQLGPTLALAMLRFAQLQRSARATADLEATQESLRSSRERERVLLDEAGRQAAETQERVEEYRQRWQQEQGVARTLAESFLTTPPALPGLEIATQYTPAAEVSLVGGDLLDFIRLDETHLGIVIADLCGHGLEVAPHLVRARFMLRAYAAEDAAPERVVTRLNRALCGATTEDYPFLTLLYGVLDLSTYAFTYCSAGNPAPLLLEPGDPPKQLPFPGGLVGAFPDVEYSEATTTLAPGAVLTLFTDGVIEARSNGELLGHEGVAEVLTATAGTDAAAIAAAVLDRAKRHAHDRLRDDVAIVVVKRASA